jgi:hypothetical protein
MSVFEEQHQQTIDQINSDGWRYLAQRSDQIAANFGGRSFVESNTIYFSVNDVHVSIIEDDPRLEWTMPHLSYPANEFSQGFRLSVNADPESRTNVVICKPVDWYMLCIALQVGLNMAEYNLAAKNVANAQNN